MSRSILRPRRPEAMKAGRGSTPDSDLLLARTWAVPRSDRHFAARRPIVAQVPDLKILVLSGMQGPAQRNAPTLQARCGPDSFPIDGTDKLLAAIKFVMSGGLLHTGRPVGRSATAWGPPFGAARPRVQNAAIGAAPDRADRNGRSRFLQLAGRGEPRSRSSAESSGLSEGT